jgi:hypothetical protein
MQKFFRRIIGSGALNKWFSTGGTREIFPSGTPVEAFDT